MRQEDMSRRTENSAHPVDVFVGTRIKQRRSEIGMSQDVLGKGVNLTFQQIQKYERGANRVGSSRLFEIAGILGVGIDYFFEGIPSHLTQGYEGEAPSDQDIDSFAEGSILNRSETLRLITHYYRIGSETRRRAIYRMIKDLAGSEADSEAGSEVGE